MNSARSQGRLDGRPEPQRQQPIAIVGMRGRFPGADDLDTFWRNIADGVESITQLDADDLRTAGVPDHISRLPGYVNAAPLLEDVDEFDAGFFGYSARDAALTDPQHRLFLETAWEALEDAGYDPAQFAGAIGVFGGCEMSTYLYQLSQNPSALGYVDGMQLMVTNDKDHLCTQVSYRLDLRGPSVAVQTTCSTSLVAVAMACESLQAGNCDLALAGGSTVRVPPLAGYFYTAGSILSPDGHCRPFDARAQGTVVGSGVGIVVLKRLDEALADHDTIRAVIRGVGINNDGSDKAGYTAPGFKGQVEAITAAYERAGVSPDTIGYVEAHGTGTILGDPIELSALTEVYRRHTDRRGYCGIGSLKSNVGHLSCASGVAGLIKTVLAVEHGAIPPTVHFTSPNPAIDFASGPFYVATGLQPWHGEARPRRAAVSSFGVGGTNAHAVLEEAPPTEPLAPGREHLVLALSARSPDALDEATHRLHTRLLAHPELDLADVAYTQHVGRRAFDHRRSVVVRADDRAATLDALADPPRATDAADVRPVVFMFPGQGSQYPGMARQLYEDEPVVAETVDRCCDLLAPDLGFDLRAVLFPTPERAPGAAAELRDTALAQPALFTVAYAVAELLGSWGIRPSAMIGHSIGEYVAATMADVLTLEDALRLLAQRGRLISSLPAGSMLAVMAGGEQVTELLAGALADDLPADVVRDVGLAALNGPGLCVLSGPTTAITRVEAALHGRSVASRRLHTSHAFHSSMMDPILGRFDEIVRDVPLRPPTIPYVATLSGSWADGDVVEHTYWSRQIRSTVRFADGLQAFAASPVVGPRALLVEVGPGRSLSTFAAQTASTEGWEWDTVPTLPAPDELRTDAETVLGTLARAWEHGAAVDWGAFHRLETRRRVSLPSYPFERARYWIGPPVRPSSKREADARDISGWFYEPVWRPTDPPERRTEPGDDLVLVLDEGEGLGDAVRAGLHTAGAAAVAVRRGDRFAALTDDGYQVCPGRAEDFDALAAALADGGARLAGIIDCWAAAAPGETDVDQAARELLLSPIQLAVALGKVPSVHPLPVLLVARGTERVHGDEPLDPMRAFGTGLGKVIPQEHSALRYAHVDVDASDDVPDEVIAACLADELWAGAPDPDVAIRNGVRFVQAFEPMIGDDAGAADAPEPGAGLPDDPVVLITGGMGHMGLILAAAVRARLGARLVLVGRSTVVEPERLRVLAQAGPDGEALAAELERLASGSGTVDGAPPSDLLLVAADLDEERQVRAAVESAIGHFGRIDVVVHGAANVSDAAFGAVVDTGPSVVEAQLTPKIRGLLHLRAALADRQPIRWVIHSSISSVLGGIGLAAYSGANAVLDAIAVDGGPRWLTIGWDAWDNAGEAQTAAIRAIEPIEGQEAFVQLLSMPDARRVIVATEDLDARIDSWVRGGAAGSSTAAARHARPNLTNPYVEPTTDTERALADIWGSQLGLDRVGVHDRFFDLGGHSLLAVQMTSEIRDRFSIELSVPELFKAPTVADLAILVDAAIADDGSLRTITDDGGATAAIADGPAPGDDELLGEGPGLAAKASYRQFYDDVSRQLAATGMAEASFFLNYGYLSLGSGDEAVVEVADEEFNASSVRLAHELVGATQLAGLDVLDVGSGRGGTVALLAGTFGARPTGVDLSPEAVAFCRRTHRHPHVRFEVGDAEHLPCDDASFDVVTNLESSHTYPDIRAFLGEVRRVLRPGGRFLHADLLAGARWAEVRALLEVLGFTIESDREITPNVLASCDAIAADRTAAFEEHSATMDNFLAVPGSPVYEQMASGAWEYRIVRSRLPVER